MHYQYHWQSISTHTTCWLEKDNRIRLHSVIRLHGEEAWWSVTWISKTKTSHPPQTAWKVGGLNGRRDKAL